jgi:monofunctional biosynthetic peptidoglycan transglycosylase
MALAYKWIDPPATLLMAYRKFANGFAVKPARPVELRDIRPRRREMLIRIEDWNFYRHHGFELAAIKNAYLINARIGRPMYGGSTLSMQTARTLFLLPAKSYFRKYLEAIVTVEIELILGKNRILELYYSYAEWGRGLFGIQAASRAYYGLPVEKISDDQYARLIALLSSPVRYTPQTLRNNRLLAWRYDYLVNRYIAPVKAAEEGKPEASLAAPAESAASAGQAGAASPSPNAAGPVPSASGQNTPASP